MIILHVPRDHVNTSVNDSRQTLSSVETTRIHLDSIPKIICVHVYFNNIMATEAMADIRTILHLSYGRYPNTTTLYSVLQNFFSPTVNTICTETHLGSTI